MNVEWLEIQPDVGFTEMWNLVMKNSDVWGTVHARGTNCLWSVTIKGLYDYAVGETTSIADAKRQCLEALIRYHTDALDALRLLEKQEEIVA